MSHSGSLSPAGRVPALLLIALAGHGALRGHWVALVCSPACARPGSGYCAGLGGWGHAGVVGEDLDLPDELFGFGSWLLWVLATRATAVIDRAFAAGPAGPSRHY